MKTNNKNILNLLSFFALIIVAVLIVINNLLPAIGVNVSGRLFSILGTIKDIFILIVIGLSAYNFVAGKSKGWRITYWIAIVLFIVGVVLGVVLILR